MSPYRPEHSLLRHSPFWTYTYLLSWVILAAVTSLSALLGGQLSHGTIWVWSPVVEDRLQAPWVISPIVIGDLGTSIFRWKYIWMKIPTWTIFIEFQAIYELTLIFPVHAKIKNYSLLLWNANQQTLSKPLQMTKIILCKELWAIQRLVF